MTQPKRVIVTSRSEGPAAGYTAVQAEVDGGDSGTYIIASHLVGTSGEVEAILVQSETRQELREATAAGGE